MLGESNCQQCGNQFNDQMNLPKLLQCQHIICIYCAVALAQNQNMIKCSVCHQITKENPAFLKTPFLPSETQKQLDSICTKHQMKKILYCKNDKEILCYGCINYNDLHSNHQVVEIDEEIKNLQENEIPQAKQNAQIILKQVEEYQEKLKEIKKNLKSSSQNYENQINTITSKLIKFLNKQKSQKLKTLQTQITAYDSQLDLQINSLNEQVQNFRENQLLTNMNFIEQITFIEKVSQMQKNLSNLKSNEVKLIFQENENKENEIKNSFIEAINYSFEVKEMKTDFTNLKKEQENENEKENEKRNKRINIIYLQLIKMENFLQKTSSQKDSSYEQQNIFQALQLLQQENFNLLRTVQELERKIEHLMNNQQEQMKNQNKQTENNKIEELEKKFDQFAELTENLFLQNIQGNDPMDVEKQPAIKDIPYRKILRC